MDKIIKLQPGKYLVAVSGGVDSVVMLDVLAQDKKLDLIVAHFDHGIRDDSAKDQIFVKTLASKYQLPFYSKRVDLGANSSEEKARDARYNFLCQLASELGARAVVTAHHQDDVIETCIINLIRGTGRHGLSSLKSRPGLERPLIKVTKEQILKYATTNNLDWCEDPTNKDMKYLRNKVRNQLLPKMTAEQRTYLLQIITASSKLNIEIDKQIDFLLSRLIHKGQPILSRKLFTRLDDALSREIIYSLLRKFRFASTDKKTIDRIVVQVKTLPVGKVIDFTTGRVLITKRSARFVKN
jgi:tRNA(Ile)-lysidine synthase